MTKEILIKLLRQLINIDNHNDTVHSIIEQIEAGKTVNIELKSDNDNYILKLKK